MVFMVFMVQKAFQAMTLSRLFTRDARFPAVPPPLRLCAFA